MFDGVDTPVNSNPLAFEELATALASLASFTSQGNMVQPIDEYQHLYARALQQPLGYREITELTGNGLDAADRRAGRAAWLLLNVAQLQVLSVHSVIWHKIDDRYSAPLITQVSAALDIEPSISEKRLQSLGGDALQLDVAGVKDGEVWLVQTVWSNDLTDSVNKRSGNANGSLFRSRVFAPPLLEGDAVQAIYMAHDLIRRAFPRANVRVVALVMHRTGPDFELYQVDVTDDRPARISLSVDRVLKNSLDFADQLQDDNEALLALPGRLDDDSFRSVPPCRGGRTLALLAAAAKRQSSSEDLLLWREQDFRSFLKDHYKCEVTRDKVRHDLVDRLVGQGFLRKWASEYFLTVKGMARYQYCLAKYTTRGTSDPMQVLDYCTGQRDRIFKHFKCVI